MQGNRPTVPEDNEGPSSPTFGHFVAHVPGEAGSLSDPTLGGRAPAPASSVHP
jgi:hypothetical protein